MSRVLTEEAVLKRIRAECAKFGTQAAYAKSCGVSHSYLRRVLCGERPLTDAILKHMNLQRVTLYRRSPAA